MLRTTPTKNDLQEVETSIGMKFPESYANFALNIGIGDFSDELRLFSPAEIYRFDVPDTPFDGWVAFATDSLGNHLSFNPDEAPINNELSIFFNVTIHSDSVLLRLPLRNFSKFSIHTITHMNK
ncbi:SMI1/KNR4 family protein [Jeongeupia naejangsanensis]|uniref:SMI1/KNR4 family protein n=1 Tax=Jeongeupia naejangsanensis TaxID=613195 RepID=A0ABS2BKJ7_9NEIS|nr:SMI1/KNR4 family protein [Jeongeupia naejangsanensis]MBM3116142.1 SMI1/KNR4 family protein [Jeongeupia naejangsanensis]